VSEIDLSEGSWIRVAQEWARLDGSKPETRLEGRCEGYGCETGCTVYRLYIVSGEDERELPGSYFGRDQAIRKAEELGEKNNVPVVMEKDWDR